MPQTSEAPVFFLRSTSIVAMSPSIKQSHPVNQLAFLIGTFPTGLSVDQRSFAVFYFVESAHRGHLSLVALAPFELPHGVPGIPFVQKQPLLL